MYDISQYKSKKNISTRAIASGSPQGVASPQGNTRVRTATDTEGEISEGLVTYRTAQLRERGNITQRLDSWDIFGRKMYGKYR